MSDIKVGRMILGMVETNCYFVYDDETKEAVVIDPAKNGLYDKLSENGLKICAVLLTHGHFDHIMGVNTAVPRSSAMPWSSPGSEGEELGVSVGSIRDTLSVGLAPPSSRPPTASLFK